jgi:hypothetical protein
MANVTGGTVVDLAGAFNSLLTLCPELAPAWQALRELMGEGDADSIGVYNVLGSIVLPALATLLTDGRDSMFEDQYPGTLPKTEAQRQDLISRIYLAVDMWAASPNVTIQEATDIEFVVDGGWGSFVDRDLLLRNAGPNLRALADRYKEWCRQNPST